VIVAGLIVFAIVLALLARWAIVRAIESAREEERAQHLVTKFEHDAIDEAEKKRRQIEADLAADDAAIDAMKPKELEGKLNE